MILERASTVALFVQKGSKSKRLKTTAQSHGHTNKSIAFNSFICGSFIKATEIARLFQLLTTSTSFSFYKT